jgi:hypothetical protein
LPQGFARDTQLFGEHTLSRQLLARDNISESDLSQQMVDHRPIARCSFRGQPKYVVGRLHHGQNASTVFGCDYLYG